MLCFRSYRPLKHGRAWQMLCDALARACQSMAEQSRAPYTSTPQQLITSNRAINNVNSITRPLALETVLTSNVRGRILSNSSPIHPPPFHNALVPKALFHACFHVRISRPVTNRLGYRCLNCDAVSCCRHKGSVVSCSTVGTQTGDTQMDIREHTDEAERAVFMKLYWIAFCRTVRS